MFSFGFGRFPAVIQRNSEAIPGGEGIGMHRAGKSFFESYDAAETFDSFAILALAILGVGQADFTAQGIGVIGSERALASFGGAAQDLFCFPIRSLFHQEVADRMLDVRPLSGVDLAIGQFFPGAKVFERGLELDPSLGSEASERVSLNDLGRFARSFLKLVGGLQSEALRFDVIIGHVSGVRLLVGRGIGCVLKINSNIGQLLLQDLWIDAYFLTQGVVNLLLNYGWVLFGLRLPHFGFHARILHEAFAQLRHFLAHGNNGFLGFDDALGAFALVVEKPEPEPDADSQHDGDAGRPLLHTAAQPNEIAAQLEDTGFQSFATRERMEKMRIGLQPLPVSSLEGAQLFRFTFAGIDRESFVDKKIPDFLAALPGIERFVLRITHPAELRIGRGRLGAVTFADDLEDAFALGDLLAQHPAQVAGLGPEDVLPDWLVTEKAEGVRGELAAAA